MIYYMLDGFVERSRQVLILSQQNEGLREGIDAVESEMALLHDVIQSKDNGLQKLKRETDRLRRDIKRLHVRPIKPNTHYNSL